jgi:hypothetical protein
MRRGNRHNRHTRQRWAGQHQSQCGTKMGNKSKEECKTQIFYLFQEIIFILQKYLLINGKRCAFLLGA